MSELTDKGFWTIICFKIILRRKIKWLITTDIFKALREQRLNESEVEDVKVEEEVTEVEETEDQELKLN